MTVILYKDALNQAANEISFDLNSKCPRVDTVWVAYASLNDVRNNTILGTSTISRGDAERRFGTTLVEEIKGDETEANKWKEAREKVYTKANKIWYNNLRSEYSYLSNEVFKICYNKAYDDGHSYGYDEVANYMIDYVYFAEQIIDAMK